MDLIERLKEGTATEEEKNEIAIEYMNIVQSYAKGDMELFSAGQEGLDYAIRNAHKIRDMNIRGWIFLCIIKFVSKYRTKKPKFQQIQESTYETTTLYEDIKELCHNDTERTIVEQRVDGYTDIEIAQKIGISNSKVHRIRMEIKVRFDASEQ